MTSNTNEGAAFNAEDRECRNCEICVEYGEEFCPLEDGRSNIIFPLFWYW